MNITQNFNNLLKQFRKKAKMTQEEIAFELNMTQSTVSKIESGRHIIDMKTFMDWVQITGCEVQAATLVFGADVINQAFQLLQTVPMFIGGVLWI